MRALGEEIFGEKVLKMLLSGLQKALSFSEGRILHQEAKHFDLLGCYKVDLLDTILLPWLEFLTDVTAPKAPIERAVKKLSRGEDADAGMESDI